ncbi:hypothetical protein JW805_01370 [Roseomonas aeriglobus]|nr:hypothetical protein [Roseomonas aeriglobus]
MRSVDDVSRDIELDRQSRESEIRLLERYLASAEPEEERKALRRCIIVVSYSHFEGFCKFALTAYLAAINSYNIASSDASIPLVAASMTDIFEALRNESKKHTIFRKELANDVDVHRLARQQAFVSSYESTLASKVVSISEKVVDAKSNLNAIVLKRNLYAVGLSLDFVEEHRAVIDSLLHVRNSIAHGDTLMDPKPEQMLKYQESMSTIMSRVQQEVLQALIGRRYLRAG